jgi:hypothetical protein
MLAGDKAISIENCRNRKLRIPPVGDDALEPSSQLSSSNRVTLRDVSHLAAECSLVFLREGLEVKIITGIELVASSVRSASTTSRRKRELMRAMASPRSSAKLSASGRNTT